MVFQISYSDKQKTQFESLIQCFSYNYIKTILGALMGVSEWHPKAYWEMLCFSMLYLYLETYAVHRHTVYSGEF